LDDFITPVDFTAALASWAGAVTLLTIRDDRDDVGVTVSAFCPVSFDPALVLVSLMASSYPAEVLGRPALGGAAPPPFAVTLLSASQRMIAGRFTASADPARDCCSTTCRTSAVRCPGRSFRTAGWPHSSARVTRALGPEITWW
jgi:flavin reductase (DIM6/NTAB) family NADH-FMN oxidoreductase RutF